MKAQADTGDSISCRLWANRRSYALLLGMPTVKGIWQCPTQPRMRDDPAVLLLGNLSGWHTPDNVDAYTYTSFSAASLVITNINICS